MDVNERVKSYLKDHGISQAWLANKVGISRVKLSKMLGKKTKITAEEIKKISDVLKVDVNIFLDEC